VAGRAGRRAFVEFSWTRPQRHGPAPSCHPRVGDRRLRDAPAPPRLPVPATTRSAMAALCPVGRAVRALQGRHHATIRRVDHGRGRGCGVRVLIEASAAGVGHSSSRTGEARSGIVRRSYSTRSRLFAALRPG
jgi:hypothetical protein